MARKKRAPKGAPKDTEGSAILTNDEILEQVFRMVRFTTEDVLRMYTAACPSDVDLSVWDATALGATRGLLDALEEQLPPEARIKADEAAAKMAFSLRLGLREAIETQIAATVRNAARQKKASKSRKVATPRGRKAAKPHLRAVPVPGTEGAPS